MKVALLLSGLPRKVQEGYDKYWRHIINNYDTDVYLHYWNDEEFEKVLDVYKPIKYICEEPFKFTDYKSGIISPNDDKSRPLPQYDVDGNFRGFPMIYSWQQVWSLVSGNYDLIIRSRYDLGWHIPIVLNNINPTKINVTNYHWINNHILDDNLLITNQSLMKMILKECFNEFIDHSKKIGTIDFAEKNFTNMLIRKDLYKYVHKSSDIPFELLRDNKLWY